MSPFDRAQAESIRLSIVFPHPLDGAAITSIKVDGAQHEFSTVEGIVEDMAEVILNLKQVKFKIHDTRDPQVLLLSANKEGVVTADDIELNHNVELINKDQHICTIDKKKKFLMQWS